MLVELSKAIWGLFIAFFFMLVAVSISTLLNNFFYVDTNAMLFVAGAAYGIIIKNLKLC